MNKQRMALPHGSWYLTILLFLLVPCTVQATVKIWVGTAGTWSDGSKWSPVGVPSISDTVELSNAAAIINLDINATIAKLIMNQGQLEGTGNLTVNGNAEVIRNSNSTPVLKTTGNILVGGNFSILDCVIGDVVSGSLTVNGNTIISNVSSFDIPVVRRSTMLFNGDVNWASGEFRFGGKITVANGKKLTLNAANGNRLRGVSGADTLQCLGEIIKNGSTSLILDGVRLYNSIVKVNEGTLAIQGNANHGGNNFFVAPSAGLTIQNGTQAIENCQFSGTGTINIVQAATTFKPSTLFQNNMKLISSGGSNLYDESGIDWKSININGATYHGLQPFSVDSAVVINNGGLAIDKDVTIGGICTFISAIVGRDNPTPRTLNINGFANLNNVSLRYTTMVLNEGASQTGGVTFVRAPSKIVNAPGKTYTVDVPSGNVSITNDGSTQISDFVFDNQGTFLKKGANTLTISRVRFTNTTLVKAEAGTIQFINNGGYIPSHTGVFDCLPGTTLEFRNRHRLLGASFTGQGKIIVNGGVTDRPSFLPGTQFANPFDLESLNYGLFDSIGITWKSVVLQGHYDGLGDVTVNETLTCTSGASIENFGNFLVKGNADLNGVIQNGTTADSVIVLGLVTINFNTNLTKKVLLVKGGAILTENMTLSSGGQFIVPQNDTLKVSLGSGRTIQTSTDSKFINNGTIVKTGPGLWSVFSNYAGNGNVQLTGGEIFFKSNIPFSPLLNIHHNCAYTMASGTKITLAGEQVFQRFDATGTVEINGEVTHAISSPYGVNLKADLLNIPVGSQINVTGKGLRGGNNGSQFGFFGETYSDDLKTIVAGSPGVSLGAGASHGGIGGFHASGQPNKVYGNKYFPDLLGSGGGGGTTYSGEAAGHGGGKVVIRAKNVIVNGKILAVGGQGTPHAGGGSGGSILIFTDEISGTGEIKADGGFGGFCSTCGSSGGGGRVAIYAKTPNFPSANISVIPGIPNLGFPEPGTIVYLNCNYDKNAFIDSILYPINALLPLDTLITPMVAVQNISPGALTFPVRLEIGTNYVDETYLNLASGQRDTIEFAQFRAANVGTLQMTASIVLNGDDCTDGNQKATTFAIASGESPAIITSSPGAGGNTGAATLRITGQRFKPGISAWIEMGGSTIMAHHIEYKDATLIFASFNLQGAPLGMYDVVVRNPDFQTASFQNGFKVQAGSIGWEGFAQPGCLAGNFDPGQLLEVELSYPDRVRSRRIFPVQIKFSNKGNIDIPIPTRVLSADTKSTDAEPQYGYLGMTQESVLDKEFQALTLELAEPGGPPNILRAGASGLITVYAMSDKALTPAEPTHKIRFTLLE